ncbi:MAG: hypothetical protein D6726_01360 [Nitrospirae bacterium]|nr:MAG: hypothetical protein D6726_01360 [Nitrospirota bacterium]
MKNKRPRVIPLVGAVFGAVVGFVSTVSMDVLYKDALQSSWKEAIAHDLKAAFSVTLSPDSPLVLLALVLIVLSITLFGAFAGYIFGFLVQWFFMLFDHEKA